MVSKYQTGAWNGKRKITMWLTTGNYNKADKGRTEVQDGGSPHDSLRGEKKKKEKKKWWRSNHVLTDIT